RTAPPQSYLREAVAAALGTALATLLIGGRALKNLHWDGDFTLQTALAAEAWQDLPNALAAPAT
ncbi:hypothetical protein, partial [Streptacidiphilus monticola]